MELPRQSLLRGRSCAQGLPHVLLEDRRLDGQGAEVLSKRTAGRYGIPASPPPVSTDAQTLYVVTLGSPFSEIPV